MSKQIAIHKFKLEQKKYSNGDLYLSVIEDAGKITTLDFRYFIGDGEVITPTKSGFRVPIEHMSDFIDLLNGDLREIGDSELYGNNTFNLHVRYVNDRFGEGVDIRKYRKKGTFIGWEKSGIRMVLGDIDQLRLCLNAVDINNIDITNNLFDDCLSQKDDERGEVCTKDVVVNPIIEKLIND